MIPAITGVLAAVRLIPKAIQAVSSLVASLRASEVSSRPPESCIKYVFDDSGNLTSLTVGNTTTSFAANNLNQQTAPGTHVYDAKGQKTTLDGKTFEWDDQGRVTAIVQGTQRTELAYDGMSRRTKITELTNGTVTSKELYFWLGGSIVCERDGLVSGFPITKHYFGQGLVQGTTKLFYTFDHLGSVRELVDDAGVSQAVYSYTTYGERTKESGNLEADWGYAGLWHHQASGLDLATYRLYDAANKRWISRDPLGEGTDRTLYSYCGNNPVSFLDSEGLDRIYASADAYSTPNGSIRIQVNYGYEGIDPQTVVVGADAIVQARLRVQPTRFNVNEGPSRSPSSSDQRPGDLVLNSAILLPRLKPGKSDYTNQMIKPGKSGNPAGTGYRELEITVRIIPPKDYTEVPGQEVYIVIYEITKEGCLGRVKYRYPRKERRSQVQR